jgi:uncharacterized membrane protein
MTTPGWALTLAYWLHMTATVVWIGGLAALALFVLPAARKALDVGAYAGLLDGLQRRLDPAGWFCLAALGGTGMLQMSANPNYQGFLGIEGRWATAIFFKHLLFLGMVVISAYLTWGLLPRLRRIALRQARGAEGNEGWAAESARLHKQEALLIWLNLSLGILILALTAAARSA